MFVCEWNFDIFHQFRQYNIFFPRHIALKFVEEITHRKYITSFHNSNASRLFHTRNKSIRFYFAFRFFFSLYFVQKYQSELCFFCYKYIFIESFFFCLFSLLHISSLVFRCVYYIVCWNIILSIWCLCVQFMNTKIKNEILCVCVSKSERNYCFCFRH